MLHTTSLLLALPAIASVSVASAPGDPPRYTVIDLGASQSGISIAMDVNEWRAVTGGFDVGTFPDTDRHAVLWNPDGSMIDLTPSANIWLATGASINNAGTVVGGLDTTDAAPQGGFRWSAGTLELLPSLFQQGANHVDERGYVAGFSHTPVFHFEPTIWAPDLVYRHLGSLGGADGSAEDRNGWGDVVGYSALTNTGQDAHAFLWRNGSLRDLGTLPGHADSRAFATNVHGYVVGVSGPVFGERAVRWDPSGQIVDLGDLGFTSRALATDINDHGTIVGWSLRPDGQVAVAWIDGQIHDLNELVDPAAGWRLGSAEAINERGDIVGIGSPGGGSSRAYLAVRTDGGNLAVIGPTPGRAGGVSTVHVVGATPGAKLALNVGMEQGRTPIRACPETVIDIEDPRVLVAVADASGTASIDVPIPAAALGRFLLLQAVEVGTCRRSSLVVSAVD